MEQENTLQTSKKPEKIVFAGPNGSGKTTITSLAKTIDPYINADEIKRTNHCSDMDAALTAPFRIFKKRKDVCYSWPNRYWSKSRIKDITGVAVEETNG